MDKEILQIMPAPGWFARYSVKEGEDPIEEPLVCWALVRDEPYVYVIGYDTCDDGVVVACEDTSNFECYYFKDTDG